MNERTVQIDLDYFERIISNLLNNSKESGSPVHQIQIHSQIDSEKF